MIKETREALEGSIRHWSENVQAAAKGQWSRISTHAVKCALCQRFLLDTADRCMHRSGEVCPVELAGHPVCEDTSYGIVDRIVRSGACETRKDELLKACKDELRFLRSLRDVQE